jgi:general L-amino acid transport system substrate-binding protein
MINALASIAVGLAASLLATAASAEATLNSVKQKGILTCGSNRGAPGFGAPDAQGNWSGLDVDLCRVLAAAIFDDPAKVQFVPLSAQDRFTALKSGQVDVLARNSTATMSRDTQLGLEFPAINYFDGQGFMVMRNRDVTSALELASARVCVERGTTSQLNVADFFRANSVTYEERAFPSGADALSAFESGECNVLTRDQSALYAERLKLQRPADAIILPDIISKEPLGPVTRADDFRWFNIVKWVNFALVNAEELGISSANAAEAAGSNKPDVRRFAGAEGGFGKLLGLEDTWALRAVGAVGNYSEIYERNLGVKSRLGIPRGLNQLWNMGGVLYAPPLR